MLTLTLAEARMVARLLTAQHNKEYLFYVRDNYCITEIFSGHVDAYGPIVGPPVQLYPFIDNEQFDGEVHTHPIEFTFSNGDIIGFMYKSLQFSEVVTPTQIFRLEKPEGWQPSLSLFLSRFIDWGDVGRLNNDPDYRDKRIKFVTEAQGLIYRKV